MRRRAFLKLVCCLTFIKSQKSKKKHSFYSSDEEMHQRHEEINKRLCNLADDWTKGYCSGWAESLAQHLKIYEDAAIARREITKA